MVHFAFTILLQCNAFDNVQVHTAVCNQALSMKALYLSTVAFSASSFCFTSSDGKLIQGPVPSFKGPQLDSVDAKVIAFKVSWL